MTAPYEEIFGPVIALLDTYTGVPSVFGAEGLPANASPPRYVWVITSATFDGPTQVNAAAPRMLGVAKFSVDVHCWGAAPRNTSALVAVGKDFDIAYALVENLITAVRQLRGANYSFSGMQVTETDQAKRGVVMTVGLEVVVPVLETDINHAHFVEVVIDDVAVVTDPAAVDPDDILQAPGT